MKMKKVANAKSTVSQSRGKNLYAAVDLHGDNGLYCVIDENDQRVFQARLPNDPKTVLQELEPYRKRLAKGIALESTYNYYWLADALIGANYSVQLVNTTAVQSYSGLKYSDDKSEARHLAHLQRLGLLPTGYIYPKEQRGARDLLRRRMMLVQERTMHVLSFKSLIERQTGQKITGNAIKTLQPQQAANWLKEPEVALMGETNLRMIEFLDKQIGQMEKSAQAKAKLLPDYQRLEQIPGIGRILNLVIMLESGSMERFASAGNYISYCRAVESKKISNDKKKGENNRKCGNKYLAWAWVEAANFAIRYSPQIKAWYQRKLRRSGGQSVLATKAVAAKLAKAAWHMLTKKEPFKIEQVFG